MGLLREFSEDKTEANSRKKVVPFKAKETNVMEVAGAEVKVGQKVATETDSCCHKMFYVQMFKCSNVQMFNCSNVQMFKSQISNVKC